MRRREGSIHLGIRDMSASLGDHIAYFWETPEEFAEAVGFLRTGLERGEHVVVFGHDEANDLVCRALDESGHECASMREEGRLSVLGPDADGELMLSRIGATFQSAVDSGSEMIRLLGNIGWGKPDWPEQEDILRFEAKVTAAAAQFPCVVICMYDLKSLSGSVVVHGAFGTHPLTIYQNLIRENPVCVDVDEYLARLDAGKREASERLAEQAAER
jgi:hypothetical protein